jgi:hypothetical protein
MQGISVLATQDSTTACGHHTTSAYQLSAHSLKYAGFMLAKGRLPLGIEEYPDGHAQFSL